jgi:pentatricopeptide repeat protein
MKGEGISPNKVTFICILKACGSIEDIEKGKKVHDEIAARNLLREDIALGTALVDMYAKCGSLGKARQVLEHLPVRDTVSWSALIAGHAQQGQYHEALDCFERMQCEGISPNVATYSSILKACSSTGAIAKGQQIHKEINEKGLLEKEVVLGTTLVDMYAKFGMLEKAQKVIKELQTRDIVLWNSLIAGYVQQGKCNEAFRCLEQVKNEGLSPNAITFLYILQACSDVGALDKGKQTHEQILNSFLLETNIMLGNALVDMYAKCGAASKAAQVFEELNFRNIVSWNALITGYVQQGQVCEALNCFEQMQCEGLSPNEVTFLSLLSGYGYSGNLDDAQIVFENMMTKYSITPNLDHHTCMVAIFGFSGYFDKAVSVMKVMPSSDYLPVWLALLGACRKWANVKLGKLVFDQAIQLDSGYSAIYDLMAEIFAAAGMLEDAERVEDMMTRNMCAS